MQQIKLRTAILAVAILTAASVTACTNPDDGNLPPVGGSQGNLSALSIQSFTYAENVSMPSGRALVLDWQMTRQVPANFDIQACRPGGVNCEMILRFRCGSAIECQPYDGGGRAIHSGYRFVQTPGGYSLYQQPGTTQPWQSPQSALKRFHYEDYQLTHLYPGDELRIRAVVNGQAGPWQHGRR